MQVATRFAIAVHILSLLGQDPIADNTSDYMAGSIGTNPVIVRNVTGMLRRSGLIVTKQGVAGTQLAKRLQDITLLDVYRAVQAVNVDQLFAVHPNPNPKCPIGANIQATLEETFKEAQLAMEDRLEKTTMDDVVRRLVTAISESAAHR